MADWFSPTGSRIVGTLETIPGIATITDIAADGTPQYAGGTEVQWNCQKTVTRDGKIVFLDEDAAEWTFDQLTAELEGDSDA